MKELKAQVKHTLEATLCTELAKSLNTMIGVNKTAAASIGLMLNLPIKVELRKLTTPVKVSAKKAAIHDSVTAYLKHDDALSVTFAFYYSEDKQISKFVSMVGKPKSYIYLSYLYAREMMRVSLRHNTLSHYQFISRSLQDVPVQDRLFLTNTASYYVVNKYIYQLMAASSISSKDMDLVFKYQLYTEAYDSYDMLQILKEVKINYSYNQLDDGSFILGETVYNNHELVNDEFDNHIVDIGESLQNTIKMYSRGTASAEIFGEVFKAKAIKVSWFKRLKKAFNRTVYYKTQDFTSTWSSLNSTYRQHFKSPSKKFSKSKLDVVLSIDHSGSVTTQELQRIAGLIEGNKKHISTITVLLHDTEIIKQYTLFGEDITKDSDFRDALLTRVGCGGTSHYHIAEYLASNVEDMDKTIYMSFSDNMSDIPKAFAKFPKLRGLEKIWICSIADNPIPAEVGGTNIELL